MERHISSTAFKDAVDFSYPLGTLVFDVDLRTSELLKKGAWRQAMDAMLDCYQEAIIVSGFGDLHPKTSSDDRRLFGADWLSGLLRK